MKTAPVRVFTAYLSTETNTFVSAPTGMKAFRDTGLFHRNGSRDDPGEGGVMLRRFRSLAEREGWDVVESLCAGAEPGGLVPREVHETLRDTILKDLAAALPIDIAILTLHGAMMAVGCEDCEGDLLESVRAVVGQGAVIGVELDPHCHLTCRMVVHADAIVIMKEYPHVDNLERADELFAICAATHRGRVAPITALFDCRSIGFYPTTSEPMAGIVRAMAAAEARPGILSVSFAHGFNWADNPETGSKVLAIADGDRDLATQVAFEIGRTIYTNRAAFIPRLPDIATALDEAVHGQGLTVLADLGDNPGGGAPGDSVCLLRAMLEKGCDPAVFGAVYDPGAVQLCAEAGEGAELDLRIGGKRERASGAALDLRARVMALTDSHSQPFQGAIMNLGACAWIRAGGIDILLASARGQIYAPEAFTGIGIRLPDKGIVAVKSTEHFRAAFAPLASRIVAVATPGALPMDLAAIPYRRKIDMDFYPRVADPLDLDGRPR